MSLSRIILKNIRANIRNYVSYFLSSSFSIMLFFIYSTLLFSDTIATSQDYKGLSKIFLMTLVAIVAFSIFFISYAHTTFMKSRSKEFGVFSILGMTRNDLIRTILIENSLIFAASTLTGILSGIVFSRLFQTVVFKILGIQQFDFNLTEKPFVVTIASFAAIFLFVIVQSAFRIAGLDISRLITESKRNEIETGTTPLSGVFGILCLGISFILLHMITEQSKGPAVNGYLYASYIILLFAGVYLVVSGFSGILLSFWKHSKLYYSNLLFTSEINHHYRQDKRIIFVLSILTSIVIVMCTTAFAFYHLSDESVSASQKNDIEYVQLGNINKLDEDKLNETLRDSSDTLLNKGAYEFIQLTHGNMKASMSIPVVSVDIYEAAMNGRIEIEKGHALMILPPLQLFSSNGLQQKQVELTDGSHSFSYTVMDSARLEWIAGTVVLPYEEAIVLNNDDYALMKSKVSEALVGVYHVFNFTDWKNTQGITKEIRDELAKANIGKQLSPKEQELSLGLTVSSKKEISDVFRKGYALFIFSTVFIGVLFFIASGGILYFKQFAELDAAKVKFRKVYRLGIADREISRVISQEFALSFYTPILIGGIISIALLYLLIDVANAQHIQGVFISTGVSVLAGYALVQSLFYLLARRNYIRGVLRDIS